MFGRSTNNLLRNIGWAKKGILSFSRAPLDALSTAGVLGVALFGLLGTSDTSFGGGPLPIDLTLIGATGCSLLTGPEITFALSNQTGFASWTFLVPDDPLLVGAVIYEQAAALQVGLNPLGLTLSDAAKFTIVDKH